MSSSGPQRRRGLPFSLFRPDAQAQAQGVRLRGAVESVSDETLVVHTRADETAKV